MSADPKPGLDAPRAVEVRPLASADCRVTARLQAELLPHGFFAQLGPRFLAAYQRAHVRSPHAVALAAVVDGQVVGFLLGILHPADHARSVLRTSGLRLAATGIAALLVRPALLLLFLRTRVRRYARGLRRRLGPAAASGPPSQAVAVLQHLAVSSDVRQRGVGRRLVAAFERAVADAGVPEIVLLTTPEEDGAPAFYRRLGYQEEGLVRGADGEGWLRYRRRT